MAFTQDFRTQRRNYEDGDTRIGDKDRLWYDSITNTIRISDGSTPGGVAVGGAGGGSYTLPTATTTIKGGVKIDGTTITIADQVISVGTVSYNSLSNKPTIPTNTNQLTNGAGFISSYTETDPIFVAHAAYNINNTKISNWDTAYGWGNHASAGYLTSVGTISYNDLSNKPTLFSGSYTDLTNKPTIPTTVTVNGTAITLDSSGSLNSLTNGSDTLSLDGASKVNLPGGTASIFAAANVITLTPDSSGNNYFEIANNVGVSLYTNRAFELRTNKGSTDRIWSFNQSGSLTFPDDTIQTTAYTATAAKGLFSAANNSASGSGGSLSYSNGVYTFTPALNITGNAATVTNGVYTTDTGTVTNTMLAGSIANAKLLNSSVTINGTSVSLGASATVTAAAGTLTGSTLASGVTASSLTSVGTLSSLTVSGGQNLSNGDDQTGTGSKTQLRFGFNGTTQYAHWIRSRHNANASTGNWIDFYTSDGTQSGTFPTNAVLGLSIGNGAITVPQVIIGSSGITTAQSTVPIVNTTATTVNFAGAATSLNMGASTGTTTINNNLSMASGKTIGTTGSITANNATAFIAGDNAISNVALQMPSESALRNLTNGATNMYFDVSIGGSTHGQFQFRSSSSYTNVLTMSSTGVTFNTDATFTSRTPSVSRTAFNAAIDTEITLDNMRFRVSNQGGIFPQVIGNGSSKNLAWTSVGAVNGSAINQAGSTGTIVADNAWTTLYNLHGMDSAGDTVTVTLQDKAAGRIYRITFMRSDNGSTTGYNIIGERIL